MKEKKKRIIGLFLALVMFIGCLSLNPTVTYAEGDVAINETNFPDSNFRDYVSKNFDADNNGFLSQSECDNVEKINISQSFDTEDNSKKVKSLKGLDLFKNLNGLYCENNQLTNLDLSKNTKLEILRCYNNDIKELDLSKNTKLKELSCPHNQLTNLDLSKNTELQILECHDNSLTSLDASKNTTLTRLGCANNQLTSLDVSGDTALEDLKCNDNQLTSLDVSGDTALTELECDNNQLTSLDLSGDTALELLKCNYNQLTSLDLSGDTALKDLECYDNQLTSLDVSGDTALEDLKCNDNQLTSLDVSGDTALKDLECYNNQLTSLDVSDNPALTDLYCENNQLTSLDVSKNTALTRLGCANNQLTSLDVSGDTALTELECDNNQLTSLDVSNNPSLWTLLGYNNPMTSVKLSDRHFDKRLSPVTYTVRVAEGSSKIPFGALPAGFNKANIQGDSTGASLESDGFNWDKLTNPISFKYKLCGNPEEIVDAKLSVAILEVVGPVDPNKTPNPNPDKYWTVKFESEDPSKGTVTAENTFYVLKTGGKTLADLKDKAPVTTSKAGYEFDKWDPTLDKSTAIDKDITVKAYFKQVGTKFIPLRINLGKANVIKTIKLKVELVIGSKEMIESIDGVEKRIPMDVAPFIEKGRTMLPIRFVAEGLGFSVQWDKENRTAILIDKENVVKIPVDTNKIIVNGKEYISDVKPVIKNDRTMLSIGNIARALGLKDDKDIHWNENTKEVIITREIAK